MHEVGRTSNPGSADVFSIKDTKIHYHQPRASPSLFFANNTCCVVDEDRDTCIRRVENWEKLACLNSSFPRSFAAVGQQLLLLDEMNKNTGTVSVFNSQGILTEAKLPHPGLSHILGIPGTSQLLSFSLTNRSAMLWSFENPGVPEFQNTFELNSDLAELFPVAAHGKFYRWYPCYYRRS